MFDSADFGVYLRALEPEDYSKTLSWRNDPKYQFGYSGMKRFISSVTEKGWLERTIKEHEKNENIRLAIVSKETKEMLGLISLVNVDLIHRNAELTSMIGSDENRGKGYILEAGFLIHEYGFKELGLERIYTSVIEKNKSARKAAEKFGYVQEGVFRNSVYKDGQFHDVFIYSILREEFYQKFNLVEPGAEVRLSVSAQA